MNECSIVRDLLPLYLEGMLSEETDSFVKAHLSHCPQCAAELAAMQTKSGTPADHRGENLAEAAGITTVRKKLRRKTAAVILVTVLCLSVFAFLISRFPVYHLANMGGVSHFYTARELAMLSYSGSSADQAQAQAILRQADAAFHDCSHTSEENESLYGLLARYATPLHRNAAYTDYSLELVSAHLTGSRGYLWVFYSHDAIGQDGKRICGSANIYSLWTVEKDNSGQWTVVGIKEHP